jgi:queuine tRNA-ribosyltransferase
MYNVPRCIENAKWGFIMFKLITVQGKARRGIYTTPHGAVQTPVFMNVGTQAAIKGGLSAEDLARVGCQIELSNTYHLHVRPGDRLIRQLGGLHNFMTWKHPILTDSGGFQIFSLAGLRKITEEGVSFHSHVDGRHIFMGPEESMQIQSNLGSDIAMAFDECIKIPSPYEYVRASCTRTYRWLVRCKEELYRLNKLPDTVNPGQVLFGINQGAIFHDLRIEHMKAIAELDLAGYALGGLAVGETHQEMYDTIDAVEPYMPKGKPRYLMGVGTPSNIIEAVARGIDFFDCVMPARNGRHGHLFTWSGIINIKNEKYISDTDPIDVQCDCPVCRRYSKAYLRHLFKAEEILAMRFAVMHNLFFYNTLMEKIRASLDSGTFDRFRAEYSDILSRRI